jgi:uncharacterized phage protein (TIGR01671 family)
MKDRYGKLIKNGDIIRDTYPNSLFNEYIVDNNILKLTTMCGRKYILKSQRDKMDNMPLQDTGYWEVIGNIYENPEPLKKVK